MPALQMVGSANVMDTERMIPPSRSSMSQNGSSPGSAQSGQNGGQQNGQNGPLYHNTTGTPVGSVNNSGMVAGPGSGHVGPSGLVVNSVARKKKTERLVPPVIMNHGGLLNGHHNGSLGFNNTSSSMNSTGIYGGSGNSGGMTNHGYTRDSVG